MQLRLAQVDDWEALYVDGVKFDEGHSLNWPYVLERLKLLDTNIYFEPTEEQFDSVEWFPETWDEVEKMAEEISIY